MNKAELVESMQKKAGGQTKAEAERYLNAFIQSVEECLARGEKVQLVGFGTFDTKDRKARKGRDPRNPEIEIHIPAKKAPVFKAGKGLKDLVNAQ